MATRAIASLSLTFGLVSIPVKVYSATESSAGIRFKLMGRGGARLRQQYVAEPKEDERAFGEATSEAPRGRVREPEPEAEQVAAAPSPASGRAASPAPMPLRLAGTPASASRRSGENEGDEDEEEHGADTDGSSSTAGIVGRSDMVKGYEFEKGRFVLFEPDELKALQAEARHTIDIVAFIPKGAVDPIYFDKAYYLAPDKRGSKAYSLLHAALSQSGRGALAKWAWRAKEYVVEVRAADGGLVLQQLLYADEVRPLSSLGIEIEPVGAAELKLALKMIDQLSVDAYDPTAFVDEEKQRILAAVDKKIAGRRIVAHDAPEPKPSAEVIDLMEALRASLRASAPAPPRKPARRAPSPAPAPAAKVTSRRR
jgi:DNA end-binding protein Ku